MPPTKQSSKSRRSARPESRKARVERLRAEQRRVERRRNLRWFGGGGAIVVALIVALVIASLNTGGTSNANEIIPPGVGSGTPDIQPAALVVNNTTGIPGVVAYDTAGWPQSSKNGPAKQALGHTHVAGPVVYSVTPPVGGDHNAEWMNCGVYDKPVPNERAVHNLEHGAVWITYQPSLAASEVKALRDFVAKQSIIGQTGSRYVDLTPYSGLPSPIVISAWGYQLQLTSPTDPRMQQFVKTFRVSPKYTPEYGGECTGGVGTPLAR